MMNDNGHDGYRGDLNKQCMTIAEVLKTSGYSTYVSGKWHVTKHIKPEGPKHNWPLQRGFDRFYGTIHGAGSFFDPNTLTRDNTYISPYADSEYQPKEYYYTDAISDHAVRFIQDHHNKDHEKPFFLYVSYTAAHWPMHALEKDIKKYKGMYDAGYAAIREARFKRMKELGVIKPDAKMSPATGKWEGHEAQGVGPPKHGSLRRNGRQHGSGNRAHHGVTQVDRRIREYSRAVSPGQWRLRGGLRSKGETARSELRNRRFLPSPPTTSNHTCSPSKRGMAGPSSPGPGSCLDPADTYIGYGREWANVSNVPFREFKHWVHEGGISTSPRRALACWDKAQGRP